MKGKEESAWDLKRFQYRNCCGFKALLPDLIFLYLSAQAFCDKINLAGPSIYFSLYFFIAFVMYNEFK